VAYPTIAIGVLLLAAGVVLFRNLGGAASALIRNLTSRSLGGLAPGYAADPAGMRVYAILVGGFGLAVIGIGILPWRPLFGIAVAVLGAVGFLVASVLIIAGEVRTYRALPRPPTR
jgi:hypothetical protein